MGILDTSIEYLKGVGPSRAEVLKSERGIRTFRDLLHDYPFRYIDRRTFHDIRDLEADGQAVQLRGTLVRLMIRGRGKGNRLIGYFKDGTGVIELVWFRSIKWLKKSLKPGKEYVVYGKVNDFKGKKSMPHPEMDLIKKGKELPGTFEPVYPGTELMRKRGLTNKLRRKLIKNLLQKFDLRKLSETLPDHMMKKQGLCSRPDALRWIHLPPDRDKLNAARHRLKFEELFRTQLLLAFKMQKRKRSIKGIVFESVGAHFYNFYETHLPFELTEAQKRVVRQIRRDFKCGHQMNRLLQGDVGSGKTIVAFLSMLISIDNGYQATMMAPTEILAQQHYRSIAKLSADLGLTVRLLTGSVLGNERREILEGLEEGKIDILIGTHALIQESVEFHRLGLAVTDEQHRFGVAQRASLWAKGNKTPPHILVMTATPIPRTMAMTLYGDLDVSVIDELPPGRKPVKTYHIRDHQRPQLVDFMRKTIERGRQAYVVYPLIEDSEKMDLQSLMNGYERMMNDFPPPEYHISMVHGQMKPEAKEEEMRRFKEHKTDMMVATTVIEVGVDVSNATVMVIENAERFGLSQLHQLRGRVGRSTHQSYCILVSGGKLSKTAKSRLKIMCQTTDGFRIAEHDLQLRGPGEMEGTRQSGIRQFKIADLTTDEDILKEARKWALHILNEDPDLEHPSNEPLLRYMQTTGKRKVGWSRIG